ncbi:hypothetical protein OEZ60_12115 [Defluviimonas sp. WL0024]|uniref:Uncharacterized protein n=1 Tax=Albidovulum salinarum TaxID=2984153 RepID=A0ABT2X4T6_9RHOB|nr:hypothetical protein [Defluviimonas sp. WL0024]MCU9848749.1 hypothetical protein [Defluviimonas sp. WL0024]
MKSTIHGARHHIIDRRKRTDPIVGVIVLAALGVFVLLLSEGDSDRRGSGDPAVGGISEDWHGNVRRSTWPEG